MDFSTDSHGSHHGDTGHAVVTVARHLLEPEIESDVAEAPESGGHELASPVRFVAPAIYAEGGAIAVALAGNPSTESASVTGEVHWTRAVTGNTGLLAPVAKIARLPRGAVGFGPAAENAEFGYVAIARRIGHDVTDHGASCGTAIADTVRVACAVARPLARVAGRGP